VNNIGIRPSGTAAASPHPASAPRRTRPVPQLEQFQALVRLAFAALRPNPDDETSATMLDTFAANLLDRLRVFEAVVELEEERFDAAKEDPSEAPPRDGQDIMDRCYYIAMQLAEDRDLEGCSRVTCGPSTRTWEVSCGSATAPAPSSTASLGSDE